MTQSPNAQWIRSTSQPVVARRRRSSDDTSISEPPTLANAEAEASTPGCCRSDVGQAGSEMTMTFAADPVGGSLHVEGGQIAQWDVAGDLYLELEVVDQGHQLHESLGVAADDNDRRTHVPVGTAGGGHPRRTVHDDAAGSHERDRGGELSRLEPERGHVVRPAKVPGSSRSTGAARAGKLTGSSTIGPMIGRRRCVRLVRSSHGRRHLDAGVATARARRTRGPPRRPPNSRLSKIRKSAWAVVQGRTQGVVH